MIKAGSIVSTLEPLPQDLKPKIIFEDPHLIVLSKPAGLLSQGEHTGDPNLVDGLRSYLGRPYIGLVHRLDRNTSGLMVVAKRTKSAQRLTQSLQEDRILRNYLAWVSGTLENQVRWSHLLLKNPKSNTVEVVKSGGKNASLIATPIASGQWHREKLTLVEFRLETGRSHQIRVQSAEEGFPLLGDRKYATSPHLKSFPRLALHSYHLEFPHPMSGEHLKFEDPLPRELDVLRSST
jgi:23S rRNA pseudouridine1911/1915/1917 synthase